MKILFISSENSGTISPITKNQGISISEYNSEIAIEYFLVKGNGLIGYLKNIPNIRRKVKKGSPDIIHAHYSFCGILAALAFTKKPIITSLMGSDVRSGKFYKQAIRIFAKYFWVKTIVKSEDVKLNIDISDAQVIPNGVDFKKFFPILKNEAREKLNWPVEDKIILFASDPTRPEKNWALAEKSIESLEFKVIVKFLKDIPNEEMVFHYNAADIILLTSLWEGSPNVIKEAMACNRPIVATDVGDISWLFGNEPGHFISSFEPRELSDKIKLALDYSENDKNTTGRDRIISLGLDSENVAAVIVDIYKKCFDDNENNQK